MSELDIALELAKLHSIRGVEFVRQLKLLTNLNIFKPVENEKDIFAAEASHRQEQRPLRYPPYTSSRSSFIDTHKSESDDVHNSYYGKGNHNHSLTIHLSIVAIIILCRSRPHHVHNVVMHIADAFAFFLNPQFS